RGRPGAGLLDEGRQPVLDPRGGERGGLVVPAVDDDGVHAVERVLEAAARRSAVAASEPLAGLRVRVVHGDDARLVVLVRGIRPGAGMRVRDAEERESKWCTHGVSPLSGWAGSGVHVANSTTPGPTITAAGGESSAAPAHASSAATTRTCQRPSVTVRRTARRASSRGERAMS